MNIRGNLLLKKIQLFIDVPVLKLYFQPWEMESLLIRIAHLPISIGFCVERNIIEISFLAVQLSSATLNLKGKGHLRRNLILHAESIKF